MLQANGYSAGCHGESDACVDLPVGEGGSGKVLLSLCAKGGKIMMGDSNVEPKISPGGHSHGWKERRVERLSGRKQTKKDAQSP